jgi:glycerophosphoryl diester phosphodiesterase
MCSAWAVGPTAGVTSFPGYRSAAVGLAAGRAPRGLGTIRSLMVERLRFDGLSVTTGTVNDAALAARAAALGVDAITTDRPATLHHELAAMLQAA